MLATTKKGVRINHHSAAKQTLAEVLTSGTGISLAMSY